MEPVRVALAPVGGLGQELLAGPAARVDEEQHRRPVIGQQICEPGHLAVKGLQRQRRRRSIDRQPDLDSGWQRSCAGLRRPGRLQALQQPAVLLKELEQEPGLDRANDRQNRHGCAEEQRIEA